MAWQQQRSGTDDSDNPWRAAGSSSSNSRRTVSESVILSPGSSNPLFSRKNGSEASEQSTHSPSVTAEVTRPSLSRLTSFTNGNGFSGLERLALNSANTSTESLSTHEAFGQRRSLDELRRLSLKGKFRAVDSSNDWSLLGGSNAGEREAILHQVEKFDTLVGIAVFYGCTSQAIRTANKLWLNDPIQLRKTLYIPLDACIQPPSREVEFIQTKGEDALQVYTNDVTSSAVTATTPLTTKHLRSISASSNITYKDSPWSSHVDLSNQQPKPLMSPYLPSTNSDYTASSEFLPSSASSSGYRTPPLTISELPPSTPSRTKKVLQIVKIPGSSANTKAKGKSRLGPAFGDEEPNSSLLLPRSSMSSASSVSASAAPARSAERFLDAVGSSPNPNLRLRPRSPNIAAAAEAHPPTVDVVRTHAGGSTLASPRVSRPSSPSSASQSSSKTLKQNAVPSRSILASAGAGLLNSLISASSAVAGTQWLSTDDYQDEMQLARDYRNKTSGNAGRPLDRGPYSRKKSTDTITQARMARTQ